MYENKEYKQRVMKEYKVQLKNEIEVRDGNIEDAIKRLRKDLIFSGTLNELRERKHFTKPSLKKRKAKDSIIRLREKAARKKLRTNIDI